MSVSMSRRDIFTTSDVARLLGVSVGTVVRWADSGRLPHWKVPGSRHRRFRRDEVEAFARSNGVPMGGGGGR